MANDRVILELVLAGRSYSEIVAVVGCSRRNHARTIDLGQFDMRKLRQEQTRADKQYWE